MVAAEVDEKFCIKLMCQYTQYPEIGELLSDALSQYIQTQRPLRLEFDIPVHVATPVPQLRLFLREVRRHHKGQLWLHLRHSHFSFVECDDVIEVLAGAR